MPFVAGLFSLHSTRPAMNCVLFNEQRTHVNTHNCTPFSPLTPRHLLYNMLHAHSLLKYVNNFNALVFCLLFSLHRLLTYSLGAKTSVQHEITNNNPPTKTIIAEQQKQKCNLCRIDVFISEMCISS